MLKSVPAASARNRSAWKSVEKPRQFGHIQATCRVDVPLRLLAHPRLDVSIARVLRGSLPDKCNSLFEFEPFTLFAGSAPNLAYKRHHLDRNSAAESLHPPTTEKLNDSPHPLCDAACRPVDQMGVPAQDQIFLGCIDKSTWSVVVDPAPPSCRCENSFKPSVHQPGCPPLNAQSRCSASEVKICPVSSVANAI